MELNPVSRTAILLMICRAVVSRKQPSRFPDPLSELCLERLLASASLDDRRWMESQYRSYAGIQSDHAREGVRRDRIFDRKAQEFIDAHPHATLVDLGCGLDTRLFRIDRRACRCIELDLPEVIRLKRELLGDKLDFETIGASVLDSGWIPRVTKNGNTDFLLMAQGLFMWFPREDVARIFGEIDRCFVGSQMVLDMVPEQWLHGLLGGFIRLGLRLTWGLDARWQFGISTPADMEAFGNGLKVTAVEKGSAGPVITLSING